MRQPLTPEQWLGLMLTRFEREIVRLNVTISPGTMKGMEKRIQQAQKRIRARAGPEDRID